MTKMIDDMLALSIDETPRVEVGPGCYRHDLPSVTGVRAWIVEMAPGSRWPHVDEHPQGEDVYVIDGEMIEGDQRFPAGSYLHFAPGSSHRPHTENGVRLIGWNPVGDDAKPGSLAGKANSTPKQDQYRVQFDFDIEFSNGGGLSGHGFRLDIDGEDIADVELADYLVRDMRLLMVGVVHIRNKRVIVERHKRPTTAL